MPQHRHAPLHHGKCAVREQSNDYDMLLLSLTAPRFLIEGRQILGENEMSNETDTCVVYSHAKCHYSGECGDTLSLRYELKG